MKINETSEDIIDMCVKCPECGHESTLNDCDVLGAEKGKVFCGRCSNSFEPVEQGDTR